MDAPKPPIAADVDLRDFRFMPLDIVQLGNSETWAMADGWAAKACINLWCRAWHQVPAGSLPNNADLHRTWAAVPDWEAVQEIAMRGFVLCSDGRLYHHTICEKANEAWEQRQKYRRAGKARWKKKKSDGASHERRTSDAGSAAQSDAQASLMQGTGTGTGTGKKKESLVRFDEFWGAYPHRTGHADPKKPARQKFDTLVKNGADPEKIIDGAKRYALQCRRAGTDPKFIAQAVTWLNQERWNDQPGLALGKPATVAERFGIQPLGVGG